MPSNATNPTSPTELPAPLRHFCMRFSSTPRGARLARRLAAHQLDSWGIGYGEPAHENVTLLVAELTANAVQHGHVPGRDFRLRLLAASALVRIEVTDTRGDRLPVVCASADSAESGRGLLLVGGLAARWGWTARTEGPGKTVWAEYGLAVPGSGPGGRTG